MKTSYSATNAQMSGGSEMWTNLLTRPVSSNLFPLRGVHWSTCQLRPKTFRRVPFLDPTTSSTT
jgi:hypothetical protein